MNYWIFYIIFLVLLVVLCIVFKVKVHFKSFLKKGFWARRGPYGTRCYHGPQGAGKTMGISTFIYDNKDKIFLFSNVDFKEPIQYIKFDGFEGLVQVKKDLDNNVYDIGKKQIVIVFDELFTELTKGSRLNTEILDFLAQLRKRKILFLTTCQSWADLPLQFRRLCRYSIRCKMVGIPFITSFHLLIVEDAENMKWDELQQDFVAPVCWTDLYKTRKCVADLYDTNQRITKT